MYTLEQIAEQVKKCRLCPLSRLSHAVPGEGNTQAEVLFVGEGPGQKEDETGRPFVGAAGKFLEEMLSSIGWKRADVFIANVVKCRPPGNRDPEEFEIQTCSSHYLNAQVAIIKPKLIVTLGRHSMRWFLKQTLPISRIHGQLKAVTNKKTGETQYILPLYHPAAALYNGGQRVVHLEDFKKIPVILEKIKSGHIEMPQTNTDVTQIYSANGGASAEKNPKPKEPEGPKQEKLEL